MSEATKTNRRSAGTLALIASASELGYTYSGGFEAACESARKLVPANYLTTGYDGEGKLTEIGKRFAPIIRDFGERFKAGHLVRYLESRGYAKRWGNMDQSARVESAIDIMGKAEPTSEKSNRRTEVEHLGVKAAQNAWTNVRGHANLKPAAKVRPKTGANLKKAAGDEKAVPTARITVPKMHAPVEALEFFANISTDLGRALSANALVVPISLKSAVQDFRAAVKTAIAEVRAGAKRSAAAKATKGTVSAADVAAIQQRATPPAKGDGASVQ